MKYVAVSAQVAWQQVGFLSRNVLELSCMLLVCTQSGLCADDVPTAM